MKTPSKNFTWSFHLRVCPSKNVVWCPTIALHSVRFSHEPISSPGRFCWPRWYTLGVTRASFSWKTRFWGRFSSVEPPNAPKTRVLNSWRRYAVKIFNINGVLTKRGPNRQWLPHGSFVFLFESKTFVLAQALLKLCSRWAEPLRKLDVCWSAKKTVLFCL